MSPPSIVVRRKPPRSVIHPAPSPRVDPGPMSVVIRRPSRRHVAWHPTVAILRYIAPRSIFVQIFIADDVWRHVAGRTEAACTPVSSETPVVKLIVGRCGVDVILCLILARDHGLLPRVDWKGAGIAS